MDDIESLVEDLLADGTSAELTILPRRVEGDVGHYDAVSLMLLDDLRDKGVDVALAHPDAKARPEAGKGIELVEVAVGLVSSGAVAALQGWLGHVFRRRTVSVDVVVVSTVDGRTETRVHRFEGSGEEVAEAVAELQVPPSDPSGPDSAEGQDH